MPTAVRKPSAYQSMRRREFRNKPLGQILVASGRLSDASLEFALDLQQDTGGRLGDILVAHHFNSPEEISEALAAQSGDGVARRGYDPTLDCPDDPKFWIDAGLMPWSKTATRWKIAAADPRDVAKHHERLTRHLGPYDIIWASHAQIHDAQTQRFQSYLCHHAEHSVPDHLSCRGYSPKTAAWVMVCGVLALSALAVTLGSAAIVFQAFVACAIFGLTLSILLKTALLLTPAPVVAVPAMETTAMLWPRISVMVPLFRETKIAERLIERIKMLEYPRSHLDVILLPEHSDPQTKRVLTKTPLPSWIRIIEIPKGTVQTKPRAMNFALPFCKGDIIGIYDAEDAPEPNQLVKVATQFAHSPPSVVCLQGRLDFYNTHSNWMARCFTIEYASWFRMMLPRLSALGGVIPLGGTTLFFRKSALLELGAWDAHNVTEDADLGIRLSRAGYECRILDSTTFEEANNRPLSWIKQRSRWLKGYAITYLVHMRAPRDLWRDLGAKKFVLFQLVFLNTLIGFLVAPVFWVFWVAAFGLIDLGLMGISNWVYWGISALCLASFLIEMRLNTCAVRQSGHIALRRWILSVYLYFPLGSLAMYKAAWEMITAPFYWDKTDHG